MKRVVAVVLLVLLLSGCGGASGEMNRCLMLREKLQKGSCSFAAKITADYGDKLYTFMLDCEADEKGNLSFTVKEPESISGIAGRINGEKGQLIFDDTALSFPLMADGQVTPVSAPWLLLKTLRCGYLSSAGKDGEYLRLCMDDSYRDDALHLDIWINGDNVPVRTEILYGGRKILSVEVASFAFS